MLSVSVGEGQALVCASTPTCSSCSVLKRRVLAGQAAHAHNFPGNRVVCELCIACVSPDLLMMRVRQRRGTYISFMQCRNRLTKAHCGALRGVRRVQPRLPRPVGRGEVEDCVHTTEGSLRGQTSSRQSNVVLGTTPGRVATLVPTITMTFGLRLSHTVPSLW